MLGDPSDFYRGKIFAGPMVRASNLPFRLMCLENGADGVYGPATSVDSILASHYDENEDPYTMYFGWPKNPHVHFHTDPKEKGKLIFQILTNDASKAVQAASVVVKFADAIDLNCGCPESFATSRGTGSSLMSEPEIVADVVSALRRNYNVPISVKHRIHHNIEESIQFAVACENAGASAIAVHGRLKEQKNKGSVAYDNMKHVFDHLHVAKIGNGGVKNREMAKEMMEKTGCESVIISSAALKNPTIFSGHPETDPVKLARRYLEIAKQYGCSDRHEYRWSVNTMLGKYRHITRSPDYEPFTHLEDLDKMIEYINRDGVFPMPKNPTETEDDD